MMTMMTMMVMMTTMMVMKAVTMTTTMMLMTVTYIIYIYTMLVCSLCQRKTSSSRRFVLSCFAKPAMRPGTGRSVGDGFAIQWFAHPVGLLCIASKRQCPVGLPV